MKIKIIDLFNDIANNKSVPHTIQVSDYTYHFDISESTYTRFIHDDSENPRGLLEDIDLHNAYVWFNLEVETIEEEKETEEISESIIQSHYFTGADEIIARKLNEVIRQFNNFKKEGK